MYELSFGSPVISAMCKACSLRAPSPFFYSILIHNDLAILVDVDVIYFFFLTASTFSLSALDVPQFFCYCFF